MYCPYCDSEEKEGLYLCRNCGGPLRQKVEKPPKSELQSLVLRKIRARFHAPLFVMAIVLYTVAMVIRLIAGAASDDTLAICYWLNLDESMGWLVSGIDALPGMLTAVGLWMLVAGASFADGPGTSGLKVLLVAEIMALINLIWVPVSIFAAMDDMGAYNFGVVWMAVIGILVFAIILGVKKIGVLGAVRSAVETGMPNSRLSGFVGVLTIIAGAGGLTVLGLDFTLESLLSSAAMLMFGIHFFIYRSTMRELEEITIHYDLGDVRKSYYIPGTGKPAAKPQPIPTWKRIRLEEQKESENRE